MNYTPEQFAALAQWESNFRTATTARWARNPGRSALQTIHDAYCAATGSQERLNANCGHCVLRLMRDAGALWLADAAEIAAKKEAAKQAKTETASPELKATREAAEKAEQQKLDEYIKKHNAEMEALGTDEATKPKKSPKKSTKAAKIAS